jgi:hypothetical protein
MFYSTKMDGQQLGGHPLLLDAFHHGAKECRTTKNKKKKKKKKKKPDVVVEVIHAQIWPALVIFEGDRNRVARLYWINWSLP